MAISRQDTGRMDEQLLEMLDEPAEWIVQGRAGRTLETAKSLRDAITRARPLGHLVTAIVLCSDKPVILYFAQIERLGDVVAQADPPGR